MGDNDLDRLMNSPALDNADPGYCTARQFIPIVVLLNALESGP